MELSIADIKELIGMNSTPKSRTVFDEFIGLYCICRASAAGVHAGTVKSIAINGDGTKAVVLTDARRLWSWKAKAGIALSGVSQNGIVASESKIDSRVPMHAIDGVCEIIPCSDVAKESINGK